MRYIFTLTILFTVSFGLVAQALNERIATVRADESALERKYPNANTQVYQDRMEKFYTDALSAHLSTFNNQWGYQDRIDFILLRNYLEKRLYYHQLDKATFERLKGVLKPYNELLDFLEARKTGKRPDAPQVAAMFDQAAKATEQSIKNLPKYTSWQDADRAAAIIKDLQENLEEAHTYYNEYNPSYYWWVKNPYLMLHDALAKLAKELKESYVNTSVKDDGSGIIGKPIGRESVIKELAFEFIPYTPEQLIEEANRQFAWCEKEMLKASAEMGFGKDWKAALESVKNTYVEPGQWNEDANKMVWEAIDFIESRDLITVPEMAKETYRTRMLSAEAQRVSPFFLGGEVLMVSYPTLEMAHDEKMMSMRGNNPHFSHATVHHEIIPGHHLQQFMSQRYQPQRRGFGTPFWTEGWSLYWEFNLWDKQFPRSVEDRVGMLFWRMHRCARIIFSLSYHLEKMTPQECIDLLVDKVGHERANAEAEVRRSFTGRYGPLYQIAYMVGGLQFYSLKKEYVAGGKMTEKVFHDTILQNNNMPVELVKAILEQRSLPPNYQSEWKFLK